MIQNCIITFLNEIHYRTLADLVRECLIAASIRRCVLVCMCIRYTSYAKKRYFIRTVENAHESVCALITRANCTFTSCLIACFSFHRESKELVAFEINSLRFSKCSVAIGKIYDKFAETKLNKIKIF